MAARQCSHITFSLSHMTFSLLASPSLQPCHPDIREGIAWQIRPPVTAITLAATACKMGAFKAMLLASRRT